MNHTENFVDPNTRAHTQTIESLWKLVKSKYNIKVNGASSLLNHQLKKEWWRSYHPIQTQIFDDFFISFKKYFCRINITNNIIESKLLF